jgi:hypothetical protein
MKELPKPYQRHYPPMRLYKDDIQEIERIFKNNFQEYTLVADKYQLSDITDLDNIHKKHITNFSLAYHHSDKNAPFRGGGLLSLALTHDNAWLYLSNDTNYYLLSFAAQLDAILSKKRTVLGLLTQAKVSLLGSLLVFTFGVIGGFITWPYSDPFGHSILLISLIFLTFIGWAWIMFAGYINMYKHTIILLTYSTAKTNLFSRNKDQIILAVTVGLITMVIASVVTALIVYYVIPHK